MLIVYRNLLNKDGVMDVNELGNTLCNRHQHPEDFTNFYYFKSVATENRVHFFLTKTTDQVCKNITKM